MGTLYQVATTGPIEIRFYNLSSVAAFAIPIGFYVDRLSAIMMTLITGVSVIIYNYSVGYMYPGPSRATLSGDDLPDGFRADLHGVQLQSDDALSLLAGPQLSPLCPRA